MKSTGIVRKVDELGRLVLPMEIRNTFGIEPKDPIEIFVENNTIILKKYEPCCVLCGNSQDNVMLNGKQICKECVKKLNSLV
ncbi:MAG: AbrB/MazE/SpoVT family DNA-binding domain-containing protein [Clostridia bacterium]|nr:AbrB/MazE/SpoVT family DNA-binding domain-containing protein [Clostridia bacterium]MBQ7788440.1 AbrB/MazE/SpoVT family DNA-binding domain-containing protein [Clostridia bacterium]